MHLELENKDKFPPREPLTQGNKLSSQDLADPTQDDNPPNREIFTQYKLNHVELSTWEADP